MRNLLLVLALLGAAGAAGGARAQDAIPDLKGSWSGGGKVLIFGNSRHNPGTQAHTDPPRVRDIHMTLTVEGQDGRLAWGHSTSTLAETNEPFAWAIAADNKSVVGADLDGYFRVTLLGPDRMERCYVHN